MNQIHIENQICKVSMTVLKAIDIQRAAALIREADGLIIAAGAGMGIDSGLPDFRGANGFWRAYPGLAKARMQFQDIACPDAFKETPELAWGFYGHRLALYRSTIPHRGFNVLREIGDRLTHNSFIFTSNVDGQFQKAGFPPNRVYECHGSIHLLQCLEPCNPCVWETDFKPVVDEDNCRMVSALPRCPDCGGVARPNILMFGDWSWQEQVSQAQAQRFKQWRSQVHSPVIIELGAGTNIPSVRAFSERQARSAALIRVNPNEPNIPSGIRGVSLTAGALEALDAIGDALVLGGFLNRREH